MNAGVLDHATSRENLLSLFALIAPTDISAEVPRG
jgi:hypothetical protein